MLPIELLCFSNIYTRLCGCVHKLSDRMSLSKLKNQLKQLMDQFLSAFCCCFLHTVCRESQRKQQTVSVEISTSQVIEGLWTTTDICGLLAEVMMSYCLQGKSGVIKYKFHGCRDSIISVSQIFISVFQI